VQSVTAHPWLHTSDTPAPWGPPSLSPPPPPATPTSAPPRPAPPASSPPPPSYAPAPRPGYTGYDAPPPDSRWHTYLQLGTVPGAETKRPSVPLAAWLALAGAVFVVAGSFLPWGSFPQEIEALNLDREFNGFTRLGDGGVNDGPYFLGIAIVIAGLGVATLLAKRLLPVLIVGLALAAFGTWASIVDFTDIANSGGRIPAALEPAAGPGLPIVIAGFVLAISGFVAGIAKRRA